MAKEDYFIEVRPVNWDNIGEDVRDNLDFIVNYLTNTELFIVRYLSENGPSSARELWNNWCKTLFDEAKRKKEVSEIKKKGKSNTQYYEEIRNALSEEDISFESYHTIKKTIETLLELGLINKRPSKTGNANYLYVMNPKFERARRERINDILEEEKEKGREYVMNKYNDRVIDFYGLGSKFISLDSDKHISGGNIS